jgi:flagellar biosynthetic protein FliR
MILELDSAVISSWITRYFWPFARISGFLMVISLIGTRLVPQRIRLVLALLITLVIVPTLPAMPIVDGLTLAAFLITLQQLFIGILLGLVVNLLAQVFVLAGQLMAMQTGLGMAMIVDPSNGVSVAVVAQWFLMMVNILFITLNGHMVMIEVLADSFFTMPIVAYDHTQAFYSSNTLWKMAVWGNWMFAAAVVIALPVLTALLIVNFTFGVMTRSAPQLNIFAIGFPFTMLVGIIVIWLSIGRVAEGYYRLIQELFYFMRSLIQ